MAIKQVKIGNTVHDIQTTIANVDGLQSKLDEIIAEAKIDASNKDAVVLLEAQKAISNKVDKEDGKGLSSNDFTNNYKTELNSLIDAKTLIVAFDGNSQVSHSSEDIYRHIHDNNGEVLLYHAEWDCYFQLAESCVGLATFTGAIRDDLSVICIEICDWDVFVYEHTLATGDYVCEVEAKVNTLERRVGTIEEKSLLTVEIDNHGQLSHASGDIYEHIYGGGLAVLYYEPDDRIYNYMWGDYSSVFFGGISDDLTCMRFEISGTNVYEYGEVLLNSDNFNIDTIDLISVDDIDAIFGDTITMVDLDSEVTF